jgi:hypothetical protein
VFLLDEAGLPALSFFLPRQFRLAFCGVIQMRIIPILVSALLLATLALSSLASPAAPSCTVTATCHDKGIDQ